MVRLVNLTETVVNYTRLASDQHCSLLDIFVSHEENEVLRTRSLRRDEYISLFN